jgi:hypothetical protein
MRKDLAILAACAALSILAVVLELKPPVRAFSCCPTPQPTPTELPAPICPPNCGGN